MYKIKIELLLSVILVLLAVTIIDYFNIPFLCGLRTSNMNWDFYMGFLNILAVTVMYIITYKTLDKKAVNKEKNKKDISIMLIKECYEECYNYIEFLNEQNVNKYIVPEVDFDSTKSQQIINLQKAPFGNDKIITELVKDGQVTCQQIEGYFNVKRKYVQYINIRIIAFDAPHIYNPLREELINMIASEKGKISKVE